MFAGLKKGRALVDLASQREGRFKAHLISPDGASFQRSFTNVDQELRKCSIRICARGIRIQA